MDGPWRPVEVGWHPVGGFAGKWFAEKTGLGKLITEKINRYPDPTQHWAVLVGDYAHQLWMVRKKRETIYENIPGLYILCTRARIYKWLASHAFCHCDSGSEQITNETNYL